ncbi:ATP-dependent DNA helicase RecQ [bacterium]|nr:ATP-dependent DNA helicase RecQ [bacterium]
MLTLKDAEKTLFEYFGYSNFREHQVEPIKSIIEKKENVLILLATGGGKSMFYTIPALLYSSFTLVISPLISLMEDQVTQLKNRGISAEYLSYEKKEEIEYILSNIKNIKILFISPEKFASKSFQKFLSINSPSLIAFDEVHTFTQFGLSFRPSYRDFFPLLKKYQSQFIALTATASEKIYKDITESYSFDRVFSFSPERKNLRIWVEYFETEREKKESFYSNFTNSTPSILYSTARSEVEKYYFHLKPKFNNIGYYHAKAPKYIKSETYKKFIKNEILSVFATTAFGTGIDKPDIREIHHLSIPLTIEDYVQQIGRAGRDGDVSDATIWISFEDILREYKFLKSIDFKTEIERFFKKLEDKSTKFDTPIEKQLFVIAILQNGVEEFISPIIEYNILNKKSYYPKLQTVLDILLEHKNSINLSFLERFESKKVILDILTLLKKNGNIDYNILSYSVDSTKFEAIKYAFKNSLEQLWSDFLQLLIYFFGVDCKHKTLSKIFRSDSEACQNRCWSCIKKRENIFLEKKKLKYTKSYKKLVIKEKLDFLDIFELDLDEKLGILAQVDFYFDFLKNSIYLVKKLK